MNTELGTLYIVATPIGNLEDMTPRAIKTLQQIDLIAAEDKRHSGKLLKQFNITTPMIALHEHNEQQQYETIINHLKHGKSIALISDAGTPLISDPGYRLVHEAKKLAITVIPIPGACAAITALSASGLPTDKFIFEGFLPVKQTARLQQLELLQQQECTIIFYEAPHRILQTLQDMLKVFGAERNIVIARELTKLFETIRAGTIIEITNWLANNSEQQQGEFVILLQGADKKQDEAMQPQDLQILKTLLAELPVKQATHLAAKITGKKKNEFYQMALAINKT